VDTFDGGTEEVGTSSTEFLQRLLAENRALRERVSLLETILETIPSPIFYKDVAGRYLGCNSAFAAFWGRAKGEVTGETVRIAIQPDLVTRFREKDAELLRDPGLQQYELTVPSADGVPHEIVFRKATFADLRGEVAGIAGVMMDVTEERRLQAQLMQADRMALMGTLAAGVAHEVNNPLAYVIAGHEYLKRELDRCAGHLPPGSLDEAREVLDDAFEGASRIRHVVRDLRAFSRAEARRRGIVDLRCVAESATKVVFNEIRHRARLVKSYEEAPPVLGDEARLGQVMLNLLINAAHALPEGRAAQHEIRVVTRTDASGRAVVEVSDSGRGIPAAIAGRVFDPFFTTKPTGVGTGLGLSICRNIITGHGGEITFESREGVGTTFRVVLPPAPSPAPPARPPSPAAGGSGRRGRILVVDDEPAICSAVRRTLGGEHEVVPLTSALEALERITRGEGFDVIICDLMMPDMTGMDFHAALAASAPDAAGRMVLLTGGAFTQQARAFLDRVKNPRLEKPFDGQVLRALVRSLLRP
jgi:PAS domain S-box-containing protein